jgi:hypothetical protein
MLRIEEVIILESINFEKVQIFFSTVPPLSL